MNIINTQHATRNTHLARMYELVHENYFLAAFTLLLTLFQLVRVIAFINVYGGIEHDGGWMLSISRSLAERGEYTTLVSTIVDPSLPGGVNVDQKFDIQAPDGRIWFFTGNGIGPASIVPDALVLKIFGSSFWALRTGPLIFYTLFLLLAALILYRLAGLGAVILFHAFLFFYPHISIFLGYEAMGEVPTMFYILWAYLAFAAALKASERRWLWFLGAGLVAGLALNAKLIALWSLSGIVVWAGLLWVSPWRGQAGFRFPPGGDRRVSGSRGAGSKSQVASRRLQSRKVTGNKHETRNTLRLCSGQAHYALRTTPHASRITLLELMALSIGTALPLLLWELVHLLALTSLTDYDSYLLHVQQRINFILDDGSGVGLKIHSGSEFLWDKFFLLSEVAHPQRWVTSIIFGFILLGGAALIWLWRVRLYRQNLLAPMWLGWLANTAWFVGLAKTGWPRHFWFGLVLAMMLLCVISVSLVKIRRLGDWEIGRFGLRHSSLVTRRSSFVIRHSSFVAGVVLLALIGWGFVSQPHVRGLLLPDEIVPYWQQKQLSNKYDASLPWIIIPRQAQAEVVEYIQQMPVQANVYYPEIYKVAEIPPQTGRIHYPIRRRQHATVTSHPADVLLFSPPIISPWRNAPVPRGEVLKLVEQVCPKPVVSNDFYRICVIEEMDTLP